MNFLRRWLTETVVPHAAWEMLLMRALFAWLIWQLLPVGIAYATQPMPNGLGRWIDFAFMVEPGVWPALRFAAGGALLVYAVGAVPIVSLGFPALLLTAFGTLENSQGAIGHHLQLACMVALAQWGVYLSAWRDGARALLWPEARHHQQAVHWAKIVIAASYVASACVKLIASGGLWIVQLPDISIQLLKTHANVFYDTLRPAEGWVATQLPYLISEHPNLTRLFFAPGLILELLAFVALAGRGKAFLLGVGLLVMHWLVRAVMNLSFSSHEWLLIIFLLNVPYWSVRVFAWCHARILPLKSEMR